MIAKFETAEAFHAAIYAAVVAGLTFEANESLTGHFPYEITYTGGY